MRDCTECVHRGKITLGKMDCPKEGTIEPLDGKYPYADICSFYQIDGIASRVMGTGYSIAIADVFMTLRDMMDANPEQAQVLKQVADRIGTLKMKEVQRCTN